MNFKRLVCMAATLCLAMGVARAKAEPAQASELSVLTYNVRGMPWPAARNRKAALREIGRQLGELRRRGRQPDVVLIQEGFLGVDELVKASGYRYWSSGPGRRTPAAAKGGGARYLLSGEGWGRFAGSGLHVLSDYPIERTERVAYGDCAGLDCLANKGAMLVHLQLPGVPGGVDVVNTHLNSRKAAKVPAAHSLKAHNRQVDSLIAFINRNRTEGAALLVGGDFNIKTAPDRYEHDRAIRPFKVVSEFCYEGAPCEGFARKDDTPWLRSQDLQGFAGRPELEVRPTAIAALFDSSANGGVLSDHPGYMVRYRLSWPTLQLAAAPARAAVQPTGGMLVAASLKP
jgi:endonuclease/exonuclease/phosphatase family metal-dependent hydrolase